MLVDMAPKGPRAQGKPAKGRRAPPASEKSTAPRAREAPGKDVPFPQAFAALLRTRKLSVPAGLSAAPPEAYASQPASFVDQLSNLSDAELKRFAEKVAGYMRRQSKRARAEWEGSPLIAELRRRRLKEPPHPVRAVGVSVSLAKPLAEWSDGEIVHAAGEWSRLGRA